MRSQTTNFVIPQEENLALCLTYESCSEGGRLKWGFADWRKVQETWKTEYGLQWEGKGPGSKKAAHQPKIRFTQGQRASRRDTIMAGKALRQSSSRWVGRQEAQLDHRSSFLVIIVRDLFRTADHRPSPGGLRCVEC